MEELKNIKDSTIYYYYEKLFNYYDIKKYQSIKEFIYDLSMNCIVTTNSDIDIIVGSLIKKINNENQSDFLLKYNLTIHTMLLIMVCNDNFIYLLENQDKTFKDVFGTKTTFNLTSKLIDIIGIKSINELKQKNE